MKKVIAFFLLSFLLTPTFGQTFFEKDTKYVIWNFGDDRGDYFTFQEVYLDSIRSGYEYYHIKNWKGYTYSRLFYKVKDNKVYTISNLFKQKNIDYHLIYDFNLKTGDSLIIDSVQFWQVYKYKIDSTKTITINGKSKKVQFVTVNSLANQAKYTFIEGLGCIQTGLWFFVRMPTIPEFEFWQCLRICMNDSAYLPKLNDSTLQFLETPCMSDSMREKISIKELNNPEKVLIYPNPVTDVLIIENFKGKIQLYNLSGSLIMEEMIEPKKTLNIRSLPKGIYYLKLSNDKGSKVKRVLKL